MAHPSIFYVLVSNIFVVLCFDTSEFISTIAFLKIDVIFLEQL